MPGIQQPGAGLWAGWDLGESQWKAQMDGNLQYLSAAVQPALEVVSGPLPDNAGEKALAWDEAANSLKYWDGNSWEVCPVQPRAGWSVWAKDLQAQVNYTGAGFTSAPLADAPSNGRSYLRKDGAWVAQDYLINTYLAQIVGADSVQAAFIIPGEMVLPAGATGSVARCNTASVEDLVLSVRKNNIQVGTLTFLDGQTEGTLAFNTAVSFVQNDELSIVTPATLGAVPEGVKLLFRFEM